MNPLQQILLTITSNPKTSTAGFAALLHIGWQLAVAAGQGQGPLQVLLANNGAAVMELLGAFGFLTAADAKKA